MINVAYFHKHNYTVCLLNGCDHYPPAVYNDYNVMNITMCGFMVLVCLDVFSLCFCF